MLVKLTIPDSLVTITNCTSQLKIVVYYLIVMPLLTWLRLLNVCILFLQW